MGPEDDDLKEALREYSGALLDFLIGNTPKTVLLDYLLAYFIPRIVRQDIMQEETSPADRWPAAQKLRGAMMNHSLVRQHLGVIMGTEMKARRINDWDIIREFVHSVVNQQRGLAFDETVFESVFESMMAFFRSDTLTVQFIVPLENFILWEDAVQLSNGWGLQKVSELLPDEWVRDPISGQVYSRTPSFTIHALMRTLKIRKVLVKPGEKMSFPSIYDDIGNEIETTLSALRLLKSGIITIRAVDTQIVGWHPWASLETWRNPKIPEIISPGYVLEVREIDQLNEILSLLSVSKSDSAFQIALRRLNLATGRERVADEDRVLDAMVALEALFGTGSEVRYRLSTRLAVFLGVSAEDRRTVKRNMGHAYDLRSRIIHGGEKTSVEDILRNWGLTLPQAADYLETLLRRVLVEYMKALKETKSRDAIIQAQEDKILSDVSLSLLERKDIPASSLLDYLISLGGTPKRVIELLKARRIIDEKQQT